MSGANEFLISRAACEAAYQGGHILSGETYGYVISVIANDISVGESVIVVGKVSCDTTSIVRKRKVEIIDIPLWESTSSVDSLINRIREQMSRYPRATLVLKNNGGAGGLIHELRCLGISFHNFCCGVRCFDYQDDMQYVNDLSQAMVCLSQAITEGRFKILTPVERLKVLEQISGIPYAFDQRARWKVLIHEQMRINGIRSPDIAFVFSSLFLTNLSVQKAEKSDTNAHCSV